MSENIEKISIEERVRFLILKHKGELVRVAEEAHVDLTYVKQIADRFKKKRDHEVSCQVATVIALEILGGHDARVAHIRDILYSLQLKAAQRLSQCCNSPVRIFTWGKTEKELPGNYELHFICEKCQQECIVLMPGIELGEYRRLLTLWMQEDETLADFAEKMGLTFKEAQPQIVNKHYNVAVINGTPGLQQEQEPLRKVVESHQLDDGEKQLLQKAEELTPVTRELLRKELKQQLLEESKKDEDGNTPTDKDIS